MALVDYDAVLYADVDIDLMPSNEVGAAARRWAELSRRLLTNREWPRFIANADAMAPVNSGLFVARPSRSTFDEGLRAIGTCRYNRSHGWGHAGPPTRLGLEPKHFDGRPVAADVGDGPTSNDAYRRDDWGFVDGDGSQGFLW